MLEALNIGMPGLCLAGGIILLAVAGQSAVGFGSALFAAPLLVWLGIPLPNVIALIATSSALQSAMGVRHLRADVPWRASITALSVMMIGLFCGLYVLMKLVTLDAGSIRLVMGCVLCVLVLVQWVWHPRPVERLHPAWGGVAFLTSGFLGGAIGMNGPPLVLWSLAHTWSNQRTRGFLFGVFSLSNPISILVLSLTFGPSVLWSVALGVAFLPLIYLGSRIGLPIGNRMKKETLKNVAFALLMVIGITAAAPGLLGFIKS